MLQFLFIFMFVSFFGTAMGFSVGLKMVMMLVIFFLWEGLNRIYGPKSVKKSK